MKRIFSHFLVRWLGCSLGLFVAAGFLGGRLTYGSQMSAILVGGLILALINLIIKPIIVFFSLPFLLLTLGLFLVVINGLMILLASWIYEPLEVDGLWAAMLAGLIVGLVNLLVTALLEKNHVEHS